MGKIWMMFEGYWRDLSQNEIDSLPKKSVSANAFEAGWKAAQQSVQTDACYCCLDSGCQSGCRCQELVGNAD